MGVLGQGAGEEGAFALSAGQGADLAVGEFGECGAVQGLGDGLSVGGAGASAGPMWL